MFMNLKLFFQKKTFTNLFKDGKYKEDPNWSTIELNLQRLHRTYKLPLDPFSDNFNLPEYGNYIVSMTTKLFTSELPINQRVKDRKWSYFDKKIYYILSDEKRFQKWINKIVKQFIFDIGVCTNTKYENEKLTDLAEDLKPVFVATMAYSKAEYVIIDDDLFTRPDDRSYFEEAEKFRYSLRALFLLSIILVGGISKEMVEEFKALWNELNSTGHEFKLVFEYADRAMISGNFNKTGMQIYKDKIYKENFKEEYKDSEEMLKEFEQGTLKAIKAMRIINRMRTNQPVSDEEREYYIEIGRAHV